MKTQKAAVIGHPIGHTMSPFIQKRLFELSHIPMEYRVIDVPDLEAALPELRQLDCFNITIPHKSAIIPYLEDICDSARLCGSVNTVKGIDGKLYGYTTDGAGFAMALGCVGVPVPEDVVIMGNGGAAKAIAFQMAQMGCRHIDIVCRKGSEEKALALSNQLAEYIREKGPVTGVGRVLKYEHLELDEFGSGYDLLVNTTSVGMYPNSDTCPVSPKAVSKFKTVFDAVYNPGETQLLKTARGLGIKTVPGMGMLVCQAAYSHKIWYDTEFKNSDLLQLIDDAQVEMERKFGGGV